MKSVILFGGGDGGGLIITENGVRPIPPFDPGILLNIKAAASMVNAVTRTRDEKASRKLSKLAASVCNLAVEQVEDVVGPLTGDAALVYQDDDGGFSCGSTGKPPIFVPWPPRTMPSVSDLIAAGVVETDLVDFIRLARGSAIAFVDIYQDPAAVAKKLGTPLSEKSVQDLKALGGVDKIKDPVDREIIGFFHKVAQDGQYLETWFSRPYEVSKALNSEISEAAAARLLSSGAAAVFGGRGGDVADSEIAAGIAWGIVCIVIGIVLGATNNRSIEKIVRDRSIGEKF
jgi:hypothetical protein